MFKFILIILPYSLIISFLIYVVKKILAKKSNGKEVQITEAERFCPTIVDNEIGNQLNW